MTIIGITGPTGAGKTTALRVLEGMGGVVIDCDAVYHELLKSNDALQNELEARFGVLTDENGVFDRKKLGAVVFKDPVALADLNAIAHRHVVAAVKDILKESTAPIAAIDAIALFESGLDKLCKLTVAITAPKEDRIARLIAREGITEEYARARIAAQPSDEEFRTKCDYCLENDSTEKSFQEKSIAFFTQFGIMKEKP